MSRHEPEEVGDVLRRVVRVGALEERLSAHTVSNVWDRVAGPRLAPHTRAALAGPGRLVIEARSAAWLHEATLARETLRRSLLRALPGVVVTDVRVRLGGGFPPLPGRAVPDTRVRATDEQIEEARRELEAAGGGEGASLVAKAAALSRALRRPRR